MAEKITKKITRKVIKRAVSRLAPEAVTIRAPKETESSRSEIKAKKVCFFCESKTMPSYTDVNTLKRVLTERSKIVPKMRSGLCSKHQRRVTMHIKYARHLSLLPFTPAV